MTSETCPDFPVTVVKDLRFPVNLLFKVRMPIENKSKMIAITNPIPTVLELPAMERNVVEMVVMLPFLFRKAGTV